MLVRIPSIRSTTLGEIKMKKQTHPVSEPAIYVCGNCSKQIEIVSTKQAEGTLDSCYNCHTAYTGQAVKNMSTGGRIESFNNRYNRK